MEKTQVQPGTKRITSIKDQGSLRTEAIMKVLKVVIVYP